MKKTLTTVLTLAAAGALLLQTPGATAQDGAPPPPPPGAPAGGPGGPGGPGGDRMEQFRQRMSERVKTQLKATDDEWSVIQPLLEKVETKQREQMAGRYGGMMGGMGGPGGGRRENGGGNGGGGNGGNGGGGGRREMRENGGGGAGGGGGGRWGGGQGRGGSPEAQALTDTLQNDNAAPADIKAKLAALREQRKKAATELTQAREDLKKVLNMRQEATLVGMGILD